MHLQTPSGYFPEYASSEADPAAEHTGEAFGGVGTPPIGTPFTGSIADIVQRKTSGGSIIFSAREKYGQYLEVIYPSNFLEVNRRNCTVYFKELDTNIYYKYFPDLLRSGDIYWEPGE